MTVGQLLVAGTGRVDEDDQGDVPRSAPRQPPLRVPTLAELHTNT